MAGARTASTAGSLDSGRERLRRSILPVRTLVVLWRGKDGSFILRCVNDYGEGACPRFVMDDGVVLSEKDFDAEAAAMRAAGRSGR